MWAFPLLPHVQKVEGQGNHLHQVSLEEHQILLMSGKYLWNLVTLKDSLNKTTLAAPASLRGHIQTTACILQLQCNESLSHFTLPSFCVHLTPLFQSVSHSACHRQLWSLFYANSQSCPDPPCSHSTISRHPSWPSLLHLLTQEHSSKSYLNHLPMLWVSFTILASKTHSSLSLSGRSRYPN